MKIKQLRIKSRLNPNRLFTNRFSPKLRHLTGCFRPVPAYVTVMGCSLLILTGGILLWEAVLRPQVAQAYTSRVDVRLDRLQDETYQSLIRRAEIVARAAAQRSFDRDILMSEVSVMVIGESQGNEAPLLLLDVSRQNWRERPDPRRWAIYYRSAKQLLNLSTAGEAVKPNVAPEK